ncbi:hypothetical protein A0H81_07017 [Grifola frondosa]|uniref:Uncharacterized protein n=1 Tax=Grifola frondosa TaxID=5627 RepID=A0A1C7M8U4_GRIFR|nr:hypothetical protein A0H81_07017 [Grifola frondosa]
MEPEVGPSVPAGTAQNPAGNAQLPLLITQSFPRRRPPLTLPSKQARLFARVVADAASGKKATALESRETLNELYKWVGARTPVRTPWDCWHRWCVPWVAAGNTDEPDADMVMPVQPPADGKPTVVLDYVLGNLCAPYQLSAKPAPSPVIIAPVPGTYPRAPGMQHPRIEGVGYDPRSGMAAFARMTHLAAERTWAAQGLGRRIDGAIREDVVTQRRQKRPGTIGGSFGRGAVLLGWCWRYSGRIGVPCVGCTAAPQNASAARPVPSSSAVARSAPAATTGSSSTAAATKPIIRAQTLTMTPVSNPQPLVFTPPAPRTPSPATTNVASTPTGAVSNHSASTTTTTAAPPATIPASTIPSNAAITGATTTTPAAAPRPRLRRRDIPAPPARRPPPPPRARPNVPVGTLGSGERPGIRAWFDHATVRVDVLERVMEMSKKRRAFEGSLAAANWTEKAEEEEEEKGKEWGIVPMHLRGIPVPKRARY